MWMGALHNPRILGGFVLIAWTFSYCQTHPTKEIPSQMEISHQIFFDWKETQETVLSTGQLLYMENRRQHISKIVHHFLSKKTSLSCSNSGAQLSCMQLHLPTPSLALDQPHHYMKFKTTKEQIKSKLQDECNSKGRLSVQPLHIFVFLHFAMRYYLKTK